MKRLLLIFTCLLLVIPINNVEAKDSVNFYVFYGEGSANCEALLDYLYELENDININYKFKIVELEVYGNYANSTLMYEVIDYFDENVKGVPFYVIGDKYFSGFSRDENEDDIRDAILEEYNDKKYIDIVNNIILGDPLYDEVRKKIYQEPVDEEKEGEIDADLVAQIGIGTLIILLCAIGTYVTFKK